MPELIQDADWYLQRLEGVEGGQGQWSAWCPCHEDIGTEWKGLSITQKGKKLYIKCHSCGATLPEVMEALGEVSENGHDETVTVNVTRTHASTNGSDGMTWWEGHTGVTRDVWEQMGCISHGTGVRFTFAHDESIYKTRQPPKTISWVGTDGPSAPPLWPMPDAQLPTHIGIFEGESDAGTAAAAGIVPRAFAITKGAKAPLPAGWADSFKDRGVKQLTVAGDTDEGGIELRNRLSREATAAGLSVDVIRLETVLDPFSGINDLNGVWQACETVDEFKEVIARATQRVAERMFFRSVSEMEEKALEEIKWLIPDLIAPGDKVILTAPQKSLKSWTALELTRSLVTGAPFLKRAEWEPSEMKKVGYVQEEGAPALWARRVAMLGITGNERAVFSHRTGFRFTDPSYTDELISSIRDLELDLVILDPLQRMTVGLDENSSSETAIVWDEVFRMQQALPHLVVMIVHHANRSGLTKWEAIRGSSRHGGEVDLGIFIEKHPFEDRMLRMWMDGRDIPEYLGTGEVFEVKYVIDRKEKIFSMDATEITVNVKGPGEALGKTNRESVIKAISEGNDVRSKIMLACGLSDATVREHLERLIEDGIVEVTDNGKGKAKTYTLKEDS